jgi:HlyD family secretion protein
VDVKSREIDLGRAKPLAPGHPLAALWRLKWRIVAGLLVVVPAALMALRWAVGPEVVVYPVRSGDLVRSVVASGHVETPYRVEIGSQMTGTVSQVLVAEGEVVRQGQSLVLLDAGELQAALVQAEGAVAQAEARLRQIREVTRPSAEESLKQARATLANAQATYDRAEQLARNGAGTRASLDAATRDLDVARTQVRTAELAVFTLSPGGSDAVMAETQLMQARATLDTARARLAYATVVAPRDGVLITRTVEKGAVVQPGRALLVLAPSGEVQLVVDIDEKNLALLSIGQQALVSADAYPNSRFSAVLTYINPGVDISRASVQVKLTAREPPAYLRQDMTVSVDIQVDRRASTIIAPARAVHDAGKEAPWALVVRDGRARMQPLRLGLRAGAQVEILEGLKPGDLVVPAASGVRAGQRIRAAPS